MSESKDRSRSLEAIPGYKEASAIAAFVHGLEDRFPDDQIPTLYRSLGSSALALGARIAEGYGRDGLDRKGCLSRETRRQALGELYGLKHYVSVCAARYYLDEAHVARFEDLIARAEQVLSGQKTARARGGSDE